MPSPTPRPGGTAARLVLAGVALLLVVAIATAIWALVRLAGSAATRLTAGDPAPQSAPEDPVPDATAAAPASLVATPLPLPSGPRAPAAVRPTLSDRDAGLSPEQAFLELRRALDAGDGARAAAFVLAQKLPEYGDAAALLADLEAISVTDVRVREARRKGERAVLLVDARAPGFTDAAGRPVAAPAVVRLVREDRRWKLFSQLWLINSDTTEAQREALGWLDEELGGQGSAAEARRQLAARGLTADAETLIAATARNEVETIELLLAAGVSPNARANDMSAWEHVMIALGGDPVTEKIAIRMLASGADLGYLTPTKMGPLALAVSSCRLELVEALLRAGAKPDVADGHGLTPLGWAQQSCPAAVAPLRKAGAR
jgi:hypothetical protein